jgi:hypothetical protein
MSFALIVQNFNMKSGGRMVISKLTKLNIHARGLFHKNRPGGNLRLIRGIWGTYTIHSFCIWAVRGDEL